MEIQLIEEKAQAFWQDSGFENLFAGCKHINATLFAKGQHTFLTPQSIVFENYGVDLGVEYAESLTVVVEIALKVE